MIPEGFLGSAVSANIRYKDRLDLGLIYSKRPAIASACFTRNSIKAAPVKVGIERFSNDYLKGKDTLIQAILVNSGNANACTGQEGVEKTLNILNALSGVLGLSEKRLLMCSTGVIGEQIDEKKFIKRLDELKDNLSSQGVMDVSQAILTTDTKNKIAEKTFEIGGHKARIFGMAKGAGMIAPNMGVAHATMLAFIMTDCAVCSGRFLNAVLSDVCNKTFNAITVDGDTSTNDTVVLMANGMGGAGQIGKGTREEAIFRDALYEVCDRLSYQIVSDGEGATKTVRINVRDAYSYEEARAMAEAIANSPLVKTALFGEDPNWGRIVAAAGKTGASMREESLCIKLDEVLLVKNGLYTGREQEAKEVMKKKAFSITLSLGLGDGRFSMLTTDLTKEYISINADYRS